MDQLDAMQRDSFVSAVGWVFEHSPWVAERVWPKRPFGTAAALHQAMVEAVACAAPEEQVALIRAHPDLGARVRMSGASSGEQKGAGLDRLTPEQFERLLRLNSAYREKFGFPFIFAVRNSGIETILEALQFRLASEPAAERAAALAQIYRIAQFRLEDLIDAPVHERQ
jgi:OHCU decarboxylase